MNNKVEIVGFKASHVAQITGVKIPPEVAEVYEKHAFGFTAMNGKPLAAAGIILTGPGRAEAWGLIGDEAKTMPFMLHRHVKRILARLMEEKGIRRVSMIVDPRNMRAAPWAVSLGFRYEGRLRAFNEDGSDALLYARVK